MRSEASREQKRGYARKFQRQRREARSFVTLNVPHDVWEELQALRWRLQEETGIFPTNADALRYMAKLAGQR